jgi:hypothetical protein
VVQAAVAQANQVMVMALQEQPIQAAVAAAVVLNMAVMVVQA